MAGIFSPGTIRAEDPILPEAASGAALASLFPTNSDSAETPEGAVDWLTGHGVNIGGFLFPHLHVFSAFGDSTADPAELANGHHDPQDNAALQALEPGLSLRAGEHLQGFATYSASTDATGDLDGSWEEAFLKLVKLPLDLELRGGLFRNRFGFQNATHNHGWMFVDQNLVNGRLLQEGELATLGGEVTWNVPTPWTSALSLSIGGLPSHEHDHEHAHDEQGHEHEPQFEAEGAHFANYLAGAHYIAKYDYNDFHQFTGTLSGAWGENEFGRNTSIYGAGLEYLWRENGYGSGGLSLRWRNEVMLRKIDAYSGHLHGEEHEEHEEHEEQEHEHHAEGHGHDEHDHEHEHEEHGHEHEHEEARHAGTVDEVGAYSMLVLGVNDRFEAGVRGGWVGGIEEMDLEQRWQISPMMTYYLNDKRTLLARFQYNWDHGDDFGEEHSVWFQLGFNWGGAEVR